MAKKRIKESEIGEKVLLHLESQGWDCYPEAQFVSMGRSADIACVKDNKLMVVEIKVSASLALLEQACKWLSSPVDYVSIAVPVPISHFVGEILRWKGIGSYRVPRYEWDRFRVMTLAKEQGKDPERVKKMISKLHEDMKNYIPGSPAGRSTPYSRTILAVTEYLYHNPDSKLKDILDNVKTHYTSLSSARSSLPRAIEQFERQKIIITRPGNLLVFNLTPQWRDKCAKEIHS